MRWPRERQLVSRFLRMVGVAHSGTAVALIVLMVLTVEKVVMADSIVAVWEVGLMSSVTMLSPVTLVVVRTDPPAVALAEVVLVITVLKPIRSVLKDPKMIFVNSMGVKILMGVELGVVIAAAAPTSLVSAVAKVKPVAMVVAKTDPIAVTMVTVVIVTYALAGNVHSVAITAGVLLAALIFAQPDPVVVMMVVLSVVVMTLEWVRSAVLVLVMQI